MARTQKDTVDYFPHYADASGGDTLAAIEGQFGNDGYAFWFKLLEKLCRCAGHYFDTQQDKRAWLVFLARCRIAEDRGAAIVDLLVEMGALDRQLWERGRIVWSQNLVDNFTDVYHNRKRTVPARPVLSPFKALPSPQQPQDETAPAETARPEIEGAPVVIFTPSVEAVIQAFQDNIGLNGSSEQQKDLITSACDEYSPAWVSDAIREAVRANERSLRYVLGILRNWAVSGHPKH